MNVHGDSENECERRQITTRPIPAEPENEVRFCGAPLREISPSRPDVFANACVDNECSDELLAKLYAKLFWQFACAMGFAIACDQA